MDFARRCNSMVSKSVVEDGFGLRFVKRTRSFGRKRILVSDFEFPIDHDSQVKTPSKKKRFCDCEPEKSPIESLPQDILIRILCGVDHDDLKQLFHVSTVVREAALVAEKLHFAYSTPTKAKTRGFRTPIEFGEDEIEAPNAPRIDRKSNSRLNGKKLAELSVQLFASPKKGLFMES
ncbi:F-box protein At1g61340-like [Euphorbia lathyris]